MAAKQTLKATTPASPSKQPGPARPGAVLGAPAPLGNRSLAGLLRVARSATGTAPSSTGLRISSPSDPAELEAERIAAQVMRMPVSASPVQVSRKCSACEEENAVHRVAASIEPLVQRLCATCEQEEEETVHRNAAGPGPGTAPAIVSEVLSSPGQPLPASSRSFFEPRFGVDLSGVRIHDNARAAASADAVAAKAYTVGSSIAFASGQYAPHTASGQDLLAHELTHVVQQGKGLPLQRAIQAQSSLLVSESSPAEIQRFPSLDEIGETISDTASDIGDLAGDAVDAAGDAAHAVVDAAGDAIDAVGEGVSDAASAVADAAGEVFDWVKTKAGQVAIKFVEALGGSVTYVNGVIVVTFPRTCPLDPILHAFDVPSLDKDFMIPVFALPLGPVALTGSVGFALHLAPRAQVQLGPLCLTGTKLVIDPVTDTYSISGGVSVTAGVAIGAEARAGLRGDLSLVGVILVGGIPIPISIPAVGLEGGLAGSIQGQGGITQTLSGGLGVSGGTVNLDHDTQLLMGMAFDASVGAYAQVDVLGENLCRLYWEPYTWHTDTASALDFGVSLSITPGLRPVIAPTLRPPTLTSAPFDSVGLVLDGAAFSDDCPIKDRICDLFTRLNLRPSQNGGQWNPGGPYGPGPQLSGPREVYQRNPGIPSGAKCRGACGPDCETCQNQPVARLTDPLTGEVWEYTNFETCPTHAGCRQHDAAFDWAAATKGETGRWAIVMPWHMAANLECLCDNVAGNCLAWIAGLPPHDDYPMEFADTANQIPAYQPAGPVPGSNTSPVSLPIDEARRIVQEGSIRIAELVRQRPDPGIDPDGAAQVDRQIAAIERDRTDALTQVVMADNPAVEIVDRAKGIYRVPVTDDQGNTQYIYGSLLAVWHVAEVSPGIWRLRSQISSGSSVPGVTSRLSVAGTGVQGRVQPFPGDVDFVEEIDITAGSQLEAGRKLAQTVVNFVLRNSENRDLEFLRLIILYQGKQSAVWTKADILSAARGGAAFTSLATQLSTADKGINSFWRTTIDGRLVDITKVLSVRATTVSGDELISLPRRGAQNAVYLDEPSEIPSGSGLGDFAAAMRNDAIRFASRRNFLKAAKRAYNYFTVIGNLEAMNELEPVFRTDEARVNQQAAVMESVASALSKRRGSASQFLTHQEATNQLRIVVEVLHDYPGTPDVSPSPRVIATRITSIIGRMTHDSRGVLMQDNTLRDELSDQQKSTKRHIDSGVEVLVRRVFARHLPEADRR